MRIFIKTVPLAVSNLLRSLSVGSGLSAFFCSLIYMLRFVPFACMYLLKPLFLRPLMFFTAFMAVIIVVIPVLILANPLFTPEAAADGIIRIIHHLPAMWGAFILLSVLTDMLLLLSREYNRDFARACEHMSELKNVKATLRPGRSCDLSDKQRG